MPNNMTQNGDTKKTPDSGSYKNGVVENQFRGGRGRGNRGGRGNRRSWKTGRSRGGGNQPRGDRDRDRDRDREKDKEKEREKAAASAPQPAGPKTSGNVQKRAPQESSKFHKNRRFGNRGGHHQKRGKDVRQRFAKETPTEETSTDRRETHNAPQRRAVHKDAHNAKRPAKEKEKEKQTSPLLKSVMPMRSTSWADDEAVAPPQKEVQSLEREKPAAGNQVSAASRAIAQLQLKVGELEQEKRGLSGKVQRLELASIKERSAHSQTRAKLESLQQKFTILERVNANFENLRTRLENERESLRKQLFQSKTRATTALGSIDYATELKRKENALESSNKEISALKADIEYHQAQHDYMQIRLDNKEAENVELKKKLADLLSQGEKPTKAGMLAKDAHPHEQVQSHMTIDDEEKETDSTTHSNKTVLQSKLSRYFRDGPLLLSTTESCRFDVISALDFRNDQVHLLDISKWDREDAFLFEIYQIFLSYRFEGVEALANAEEFSSVVWRAIYEGLCQLCTKEILVFINCTVPTPQANHASALQVPSGLSTNQESTLRFFVSCLAAAYDSVSSPRRVVIVLEGWTRDKLKGEDLSGQGEYKQFHVVHPFNTLVL